MFLKPICFALSTLALGGGMMALPQEANAKSLPALSVYGEAVVEKEADCATVFAKIQKISNDKEEIDEIVEDFSTLKENLENIGIAKEQIKTLYFYDGLCNFEGNIAYRANLDFFVKSENIANLKEIVSTILEEDDACIENVTYELKDTTAYNEALSLAKDNALEKANSLLKTDNMQIQSIEEECFYHCASNYRDFVLDENEDYIEMLTIRARVKVTMDYVENGEQTIEENIDKETGEILEEELPSQEENIDKETGEEIIEAQQEENEEVENLATYQN